MEKTVLNRTLSLDTAPMHIAPGGSILYHMTGAAADIAAVLCALREEIAYGMADVTMLGGGSVRVDIYFGAADDVIFKEVVENSKKTPILESEELPEGFEKTGLSMQARNLVIDALKG